MEPNIYEIETRVFEALKSLGCKTLKTILNVEPNTTLRTILLDSSYTEQKINIFAWVICKFEPRLAGEFSSNDFVQLDVKARKIAELLTTLGLVAPGELTQDRLLKTSNEKIYQDMLLILDELTDMMRWQTKLDVSDLDDLMAFHLNLSTTMTTHHHLPPAPISTPLATPRVVTASQITSRVDTVATATTMSAKSFQERLDKKLQIIYDDSFWREWQKIAKPNTTSCIMPDMQRIIRTIVNERGAGVLNESLIAFFQAKSIKRDELKNALANLLNDLREQSEKSKLALCSKAASTEIELVELQDDELHERFFVQLESDFNEITLCLNEFNRFSEMSFDNSKLASQQITSSSSSSSVQRIVEFDDLEVCPKTKLESALEEYSIMYEMFQESLDRIVNFSKLIKKQRENQIEYEENCSLAKNNKIERYINWLDDFSSKLDESTRMLGHNMIEINDKKEIKPTSELL